MRNLDVRFADFKNRLFRLNLNHVTYISLIQDLDNLEAEVETVMDERYMDGLYNAD